MTGPQSWTDEQLAAIERRQGELLLDAGAGSGKTSVLVERFARAVIEDGLEVSSILAITFTDKAAAELRDRIRARLGQLGATDQARATEGAFISTIHGFCARVLRAGALAAGLDPSFVVLDRDQSELLAVAAFEDALQDLAGAGGDGVELIADYGAAALRDAILAVYGQLRSRGQRTPRLSPCPPPPGPEAAAELHRAALAVASELAAVTEPSANVAEAGRRLDRCRELLAGEEPWPGELHSLKLPGNGAALSTDACVAYGQALAAYRAACAARAAGPVRDRLDTLLAAFGDRYGERKRAVSGVDFEDLELLTLELLRSRDQLRERYAQRFALIMVDELQDTNRVQLELIESIASENLFTVGDAQQSIYRFRHAEVELFERRGERLAASGRRETLRINFRSRPEILAALNAAFQNELGERFKPLVAGRDAQRPPGRGASVELLLVDKGADWELDGLASPWRLAEARALADRLAQLVVDGTSPGEIVVLTRATTDMRVYERALEHRGLPTYVIGGRGYWLHPQVLDMVAYLRVLSNPLDEQSLYTVLCSPLVGVSVDALVVLAGVAREQDRAPWSVLGEPGDELECLEDQDRRALGEFRSWLGRERPRVAGAGLEDLIDGALRRTGYDLAMLAMPGGRRRLANVRKLMRLARAYEHEHGPDLRGFVSFLADREAGRATGSRESEAPVEGEGLDAIRLMTIHRAKGLEFDTVCVADLGRSMRPPHELLRVGADGRLGVRLARCGTPGRASALDYEALGDEEKEAAEREERRLFYVAMTRARERLILSGATRFEGWGEGKATGGGPVGWIAPAFVPELGRRIAEGGGEVALGDTRIRLTVALPGAEATPTPWSCEPPAAPAPPAPPPPPPPARPAPPVTTLSYTSLVEYARCGYRFYSERVLGLPGTPEDSSEGEASGASSADLRGGAERGVLLHLLLQRLSFRRPVVPGPELIAAVAADAGLRAFGADEARELTDLVARFAASELCGRLARAIQARREQRFAFELGGAGLLGGSGQLGGAGQLAGSGQLGGAGLLGGSVLITGAIDVLARERDRRMVIVDYKSDRLAGADPARVVQTTYATQRLVYALAALHAGAEAVEVAHCFLDSPERPVTATFDRSQLDELELRLTQLAGGVRAHRFEVSPAPHRALCAGCPAQGGLCSWPLQATRRQSVDRLF